MSGGVSLNHSSRGKLEGGVEATNARRFACKVFE